MPLPPNLFSQADKYYNFRAHRKRNRLELEMVQELRPEQEVEQLRERMKKRERVEKPSAIPMKKKEFSTLQIHDDSD